MANSSLSPQARIILTCDYQHRFKAGMLPAALHNLPDNDPLFTNPSVNDYTLQPCSTLRHKGGPLTFASGAGRNSTCPCGGGRQAAF